MASAPSQGPGLGFLAVVIARIGGTFARIAEELASRAWWAVGALAGLVAGAVRLGLGRTINEGDPLHAADKE